MLDLDRLEKIGKDRNDPPKAEKKDDGMRFAKVEILTPNKIPYHKCSFMEDDYHICAFCRENTLQRILDYRCTVCKSKVIKWECYLTHTKDTHIHYDKYIADFNMAVDLRFKAMRKKNKK